MVFTVEEINQNSSLLPGVKLGYRLMDSCDHVHTSLQALFSLISRSKAVTWEGVPMETENRNMNLLKTSSARMKERNGAEKTRKKRMLTTSVEESREMCQNVENNKNATEEIMDMSTESVKLPSCLADSPVPVVIGLASSSPTRAVAQTLGPFNIPLVRKTSGLHTSLCRTFQCFKMYMF